MFLATCGKEQTRDVYKWFAIIVVPEVSSRKLLIERLVLESEAAEKLLRLPSQLLPDC